MTWLLLSMKVKASELKEHLQNFGLATARGYGDGTWHATAFSSQVGNGIASAGMLQAFDSSLEPTCLECHRFPEVHLWNDP